MAEETLAQAEMPNVVSLLARVFPGTAGGHFLHIWENIIFSVIVAFIVLIFFYLALRNRSAVPGRLQCAAEILIGGIDDFICGIMGPHGRKYVPFIGTLFIYILSMNLFGLIPFMKSPTSNLSVTFALAICVFFYVQYAAFKELGPIGYVDHLMGRPRGFIAFSVVIPLLMLFMHVISEFIRPITLSLRLRNNIWGDDMLLAMLAGFGIKGVPFLIFSTILIIIAAFVQAVVFSLLTTIYFTFILNHEGEIKKEVGNGL